MRRLGLSNHGQLASEVGGHLLRLEGMQWLHGSLPRCSVFCGLMQSFQIVGNSPQLIWCYEESFLARLQF